MIEARAAGKLFVAGEYAVVEPGGSAVVIAVDRHVTVRLQSATGRGAVRSEQDGHRPFGWRRDETGAVLEDDRPVDHVFSAIRTVETLVADLGLAPRFHSIAISSELDDASGRKFGLGSSGAVTVAAVRALDELYGLRLTRTELFKLALLATVDVAPTSSGGDVAASCFGGWVAYRSPDRAALAALRQRDGVLAALRTPWPHLEISRLPAPAGLDLVVGWTGEAASTSDLVDDVHARRSMQSLSYDRFLAESRARVEELTAGLRDGRPEQVLGAVHAARRLLVGLGTTLGIDIETPALTRLCEAAEGVGAAAKSSGAGGGDCGIVLAPAGTDLEPMLRGWQQAGIRRLALAVAPPVVDLAAE
ncbi:phosphomevalonate kinase [Georgenia sp. MJ173]|uniref:phosphomevalonate kinase n=1 Tax=Georgenia sunbinii TaxID=3117728 RepID=UPI002F266D85